MAEYNGIVAGIGDKENRINLIKPEYDAALNYYILGKSKAVITGLNIEGTTLKKGVCALCGYVGTLETDIQNITGYSYIYGRFTLNFGNGLDQFDIIALTFNPAYDNVNPASITEAGVYYISLYYIDNGVPIAQFDTIHNYPESAYTSDRADLVTATIAEDATGTTQPVNSHTTYPTRIATCEYVHNQIEEEIDFNTTTINVEQRGKIVAVLTIKRKSKYAIGNVHYTGQYQYYTGSDNNFPTFTLPNGYLPKTQLTILLSAYHYTDDTLSTLQNEYQIVKYVFNANTATPTVTRVGYVQLEVDNTFGYEIN